MMEAKQAAPDRLSSLPAELQDEILVRLDLRDAVRTSALSRTWRDLWKSLSVISLSFPFGTHPSVVDSVLLRYIGPRVSLFRICVDDACADRIDDWLIALSRYRVESIDMCGTLRSLGNFNLHSSIFSLGDLVSLLLKNCRIPPLPVGFPGFPALQKLVLAYLCVDFNEIHSILSMFTMLRSCHNLQNLKIESRHVSYESFEADWEFLNALWTDGMCANLQIVRMIDIISLPNETSFMKLILSKATLLHTLYVGAHPYDFDDHIIDMLKCKRASAQARVQFEVKILILMYLCKLFYCTSESGLYFIEKLDPLRKDNQHKTFAEVFYGPLRL
ncbi:F-box/FBD/LRR-repeat protein [Zea mays]|uniref:F-box/FBD/LRR-repeat protein n=1 Tax=Zea mays TaxID=4577 RepID=A0A3L6EHL7_MAIZE|nr:F-box/FBD/LRR-repeat protein [Zea mays]